MPRTKDPKSHASVTVSELLLGFRYSRKRIAMPVPGTQGIQ
jgi:hypothetical protein